MRAQEEKLSIAFVTMGLEFTGDTIKEKGLGGSETAALCLARELAARGHHVSMFCKCPKPGIYDGVEYYQVENFEQISAASAYDVLVASRWPEFLTMPVRAGLKVLWLHDLLQNPGRLVAQSHQTDLIFLLSDYHIANYIEGEDAGGQKCAWIKPIVQKSRNGVDLELIERIRAETEKVPGKVLFTSRPERGLDYLTTEIFPELLKEFPDLQLHYCHYDLHGMNIPAFVQAAHDQVEEQTRRYPDNLKHLGHLNKEQLYREMCSAELLLYPTSFGEISCISAMEAQACGTPIITTDGFALSETVGPGGVKIQGRPGEPAYKAKFIRKTVLLLKDDALRQKLRETGIKWIEDQGYSWASVAQQWEETFYEKLSQRTLGKVHQVARELLRQGDLVRSRNLLNDFGGNEKAIEEGNALIESAKYALTKINEGKTTQIVKDEWTEAMPRFIRALDLMTAFQVRPQVVWDFRCGDTAFGAVFSRAAGPESICFLIDRDLEVLKRAAGTAEKVPGDNGHIRTVQAESLSQVHENNLAAKPDMIFLGNVLEQSEDPASVLREAMQIVGPEGHVLLTSTFGPHRQDATYRHAPLRLWSFDQEDWRQLLGNYDGKSTFHSAGVTPSGDAYGDWCVLLSGDSDPAVSLPNTWKKARATRPYQTLSVCMIAKDEEDWITGCIKKVYPIADEIIIALDDRSSDATEPLLKSLDIDNKIEIRPTTFEDFGQMRNASVDGAEGDWIFWIDADEILTNPENIRPLLHSKIHEGFSIKQCHLMLDVHGTFDTPVRIYRNRQHYKFVGAIHEHCEDVSEEKVKENGLNNPIQPSMLINRSSLAHYGYLDESQRRAKCSNRNMRLLRKDIEVNGVQRGRKLSFILGMRDLNNIAKWSCGMGPFAKGSREHRLLEATCQVYHKFFAAKPDRFQELCFGMYQEALRLLGERGIPVGDRKAPPFCVAIALGGSVGQEAEVSEPSKIWFMDEVEYQEFVVKQHSGLLASLNLAPMPEFGESNVKIDYDETWPELLELGADAIDGAGRFRK